MPATKKFIGRTLGALFILFCGLTISAFWVFMKSNNKNTTVQYLLVYPTDDETAIFRRIDSLSCVDNMTAFKIAAKTTRLNKNIHAGRYEISKGMNNLKILSAIRNRRQTPLKLTFNNIRTKDVLADKISEKLMMTKSDFINELDSDSTLIKYGLTKSTNTTIFLPNTYEVYWDITPTDLIEKMKKEYDRFWNEERTTKLVRCGLSKAEVSTLASIVEEETVKKDERPIVAGLYLNRLRIGMPLQADPTIKYAMQDFSIKRILNIHRQVDSPYNTYNKQGLPPGPIRIASQDGIDAVLNYVEHKYLYMCAKSDFSGYHDFAQTYDEHIKNANKYHKELDRRGF